MSVRRVAAAGLLALFACGPLAAQTNERIYENLDFRFVTPGARAIGMGKTFVGLADDATAAYSNPAGLSNLLAKEVSVEWQTTSLRHERLTSLTPAGPIQTGTFGDTVSGPSFASFVWPWRRLTASMFLSSVQDYRETFAFEGRPVPGLGVEDGAFGTLSIRSQQYGLGLSYVVTDRVSVGASLAVSSLDLATEGRSGTPENPRNGTNTIDHGTRLTAMGGVLVKPARGVSVGLSVFGGADYRVDTTLFGTFLAGDDLASLEDVVATGTKAEVAYVVPPRASLGASWRVADSWTVLADVSRIAYSRQVGEHFEIVDFRARAFGLTRENFFVRDVWEVHAGAEYRLYRPSWTGALRAGVFTDPDHRVRFRRTGAETVASSLLDFRFNTVSDETDVGVTVGAGVMLRNRFQLDVAGSLSPDAHELVVSMVMRP